LLPATRQFVKQFRLVRHGIFSEPLQGLAARSLDGFLVKMGEQNLTRSGSVPGIPMPRP
jgi:hypothetical protein